MDRFMRCSFPKLLCPFVIKCSICQYVLLSFLFFKFRRYSHTIQFNLSKYSLGTFSTFTVLCNHHLYVVPEQSCHPKR